MPEADADRLGRLQRGAGLAALLLGVAFVGYTWTCAPDAATVVQWGETPWVGAPTAVAVHSTRFRIEDPPVTRFERQIELEAIPERARLHLRAMRSADVFVNGALLPRAEPESWKRGGELDLAGALRTGGNEIRIEVRNTRGPGLVQARVLDASIASLSTAHPGWTVSVDSSAPAPAVRADDTTPAPTVYATPRLLDALRDRAGLLALAWCVAIAVFALLGSQGEGDRLRTWLRRGFFAALGLVWAAVFAKAAQLPIWVGFDGPDHLAYVRFLLEEGRVPLASDGSIMYHPPLFYALVAGVFAVTGEQTAWWRLLPFACGLVQAALAWRLARLLLPESPARAYGAALCAALAPMNLYMSSYLSNEPLHAALAGGALVAAVTALLRPGPAWRWLGLAGVLAGAAILAKVTSAVLVPLVAVFATLEARWAGGASWLRALARGAFPAALALAISGWFFARNVLHFGRAVVGNWDMPGARLGWWQHPGFHTPDYYLAFGRVFERPFFASYRGFLDGLYSTFWGDGLIGGLARWGDRPPVWSWEGMTLVYAFAVPVTLAALLGAVSLVRLSVAGSDVRRRLALSFVVATVAAYLGAVLHLNWVHPAYGMTKSFYLLAVLAPLSVATAHGFAVVDERLRGRAAGWLPVEGDWLRIGLWRPTAALLVFTILWAFLG